MQQIQLTEATQNLMGTDLNSVQLNKDCLNSMLSTDGNQGLIFQDSSGAILDGSSMLSNVISSAVETAGESLSLENEIQKSFEEPEDEPSTLCEKCGIDFANESSLRLHEKLHIDVQEPRNKLSDVPPSTSIEFGTGKPGKVVARDYICTVCSYTCYTQKNMLQHLRAHTGFELTCKADKCDFSTPFENTLKEHIATEHVNEIFIRYKKRKNAFVFSFIISAASFIVLPALQMSTLRFTDFVYQYLHYSLAFPPFHIVQFMCEHVQNQVWLEGRFNSRMDSENSSSTSQG